MMRRQWSDSLHPKPKFCSHCQINHCLQKQLVNFLCAGVWFFPYTTNRWKNVNGNGHDKNCKMEYNDCYISPKENLHTYVICIAFEMVCLQAKIQAEPFRADPFGSQHIPFHEHAFPVCSMNKFVPGNSFHSVPF